MALKAKELRELSDSELEAKLEELKKELFKIRMEQAVGQISNPMRKREIRRDIARILTVLNEKKRRAPEK